MLPEQLLDPAELRVHLVHRAVLAAAGGVVGVRQILEPAHQHADVRARRRRRPASSAARGRPRPDTRRAPRTRRSRGRRARAPARGCADSSRAARPACSRGRPAPTRVRYPWQPARAACGRSRDSCRRGSTSLQRRVARIARYGDGPGSHIADRGGARRSSAGSRWSTALYGRRSRRFPLGGEIPDGPLAYRVAPRPAAAVRARAAAGADRRARAPPAGTTRSRATSATRRTCRTTRAAPPAGRSPRRPASTPASSSSPTTRARISSPPATRARWSTRRPSGLTPALMIERHRRPDPQAVRRRASTCPAGSRTWRGTTPGSPTARARCW